ncbi:MarR family winged helix-turn-helix transcriptional regulator [Nocardioides solisilvae]|uniref:MarR family winged helix-turn-helix transcriptional regulator n=1 Tax=Nocardioides solisilvae TaxID=1542435 RepID=UPI000D7431F9|nr:MarR family winged helix-turn-helix transcriptional regulator [Nocardioides solisilvae]
MTSDAPWLSDAQQRAWRGWLALGSRLPAALHRQLQAESGLSLQDFEVLVHLSEAAGSRARVLDLARALEWERSRLSHHVTRMERRGLVAREECSEDGRGAFVVLVDAGRAALEAAAPTHAHWVKEVVFGGLSAEDVAALERITGTILSRI